MTAGYESVIDFSSNAERIITINFPLYSNVKKLYIGLDSHSMRKAAPDYKYEKPIVYYGSSITRGGCASRPGNSYQSMISRKLDTFADRREVIRETYQTAIAEGDENVYFIDGAELFAGGAWDSCTVDRVHPNDLGFYRMARRIKREIAPLL